MKALTYVPLKPKKFACLSLPALVYEEQINQSFFGVNNSDERWSGSQSCSLKYEKADDSAGFLLWKITALWQRKLAQVLGEFGITQTQYAMLASLKWFEEKKEPTTQAHLVEHAKIDKMTVSKAIRKLAEEGLVLREPSSSDSRATNVQFTAHGKKVIQKAIVAIENADEEFFSCLSEQQLEIYKSLTTSVIAKNGL